ncbi:MAG: CaiB/BaiF CoA transferase family protein, partial [Dehalococcoidia bacterium]
EPPGGDPSRNIGPFYHDIPDPQKSLTWFAFNTSKRSLTLGLETPAGRETFLKLVRRSDFVIESFCPGYMDRLGLGYESLSQINPGIIMVSISPFGQTGPRRHHKIADIVAMAMGGQMYVAGDPDRPPVRISAAQAYLHAGAHAAVGALIALHHRHASGQGQQVDVSIQQAVVRILGPELVSWEFNRYLARRSGPRGWRGRIVIREVWPCKDGEITFRVVSQGFQRLTPLLVQWMSEEGMASIVQEVDWAGVDLDTLSEEEYRPWEEEIGRFFLAHTKAELFEEALKRRIPIMLSSTPQDVWQSEQLRSRDFWVEVEHPELGRTISYPGAPFRFSTMSWRIARRAPLIGEHNEEVLSELDSVEFPGPVGSTPVARVVPGCPASGNALEGIRVIDFSRVITGPLITKYLADFGAEVIKIESRTSLDATRTSIHRKDVARGPNSFGGFIHVNTSKHSMNLNMKSPQGGEVARRLVARADVVVENFAPGVMSRWGLDYESLRKIKPDIIMLSTSVVGQTGPYSRHPGYGWNLSGLAGFNHFTGWPDREGVAPSLAHTDYLAPWFGVVAVLCALDHRRRTGQGQYIDLSQFEASLSFLSPVLLDYMVNGRLQTRCGNRCPCAAPHGAYPCRGEDRWCVVAVFTQEEWQAFRRAIGDPQWSREPRFATLKARKQNEDELDALVSAWTVGCSDEHVMDQMQAVGVAAGIVQSTQDLLDRDPQVKHRGCFPRLEHPVMGWCHHYSWPARLLRTPAQVRPAPLFGEYTEYACTQILGMSQDRFLKLQAEGVFE